MERLLFPQLELLIEFEYDRYGEGYTNIQRQFTKEKVYPLTWEYINSPECEFYRKYNFCVEFSDLPIESYLIQSISNPSIVDGEWQPISMEIKELLENEPASIKLMRAIKKQRENIEPDSFQICTIKMLDPVGIEINKFEVWYQRFDVFFPDWGYNYKDDDCAISRLVIHPIHINFNHINS